MIQLDCTPVSTGQNIWNIVTWDLQCLHCLKLLHPLTLLPVWQSIFFFPWLLACLCVTFKVTHSCMRASVSVASLMGGKCCSVKKIHRAGWICSSSLIRFALLCMRIIKTAKYCFFLAYFVIPLLMTFGITFWPHDFECRRQTGDPQVFPQPVAQPLTFFYF